MKKVKVIACAVLSNDLNGWAEKLGISLDTEYLEAGLHEEPQKLKSTLKEAVDRASREGIYDRIIIGYGLCGLGTVGLQATTTPLVLPRAHDCIALFMGSDKLYREQFSRNPGTLYMSRGWYENKTQPQGIRKQKGREAKENWGLYEGFETLKGKYGEQNALEIYEFINTWKKNYTRSVFIDTGLSGIAGGDDTLYENFARDLADELDLKYEKITGKGEIFHKMLTASETDDEIIQVLPGYRTGYDPLARGLYAYKEEEDGALIHWDRALPVSKESRHESREGLGLGIDAGGTYTDAVIYDYTNDKVLAKGKSPTTKWDYTLGIDKALATLPPAMLEKVDLTVVSTTLATNAIVENQGQKVGLILMPLGKETGEDLPSPWAAVGGKLNIQGEELESLDEEEIRRVVREMVREKGVGAFAVSGYGGTANPVHEIRIREIIKEETCGADGADGVPGSGMSVCCGHELSSSLNFYVRANTAVLNAGIIPLLESFIENLEEALAGRNVNGRVMIVRGDGSLMSREMARSHPVETALSGPAASVTGARYMVDRDDLLVIDVGGTTSDIGLVEKGEIRLTEEGAHVGSWRTHVKAVDMNTLGTGGDSRILIERRRLTVGPRRIAPICRLSSLPGWEKAVGYMEKLHDNFFSSTEAMEVLAVTGREPDEENLTNDEKRLYQVLTVRPHTLKELALTQGHGLWHILDTSRLEKKALVQRYGLTPTDILVARGDVELWDKKLAGKILGLYETIWNREEGSLAEDAFARVHRNIMETLLLQELDLGDSRKNLSIDSPVFQLLMNRLEGSSLALNLRAGLEKPLVGVGAAAPFLLEQTAKALGTELIIPRDGDVANAVGAVCSLVTVRQKGEIQPGPEGSFLALGLGTVQSFENFDLACLWLEQEMASHIREEARLSGTEETAISWEANNRISQTGEGVSVFLGRSYTARITGLPA